LPIDTLLFWNALLGMLGSGLIAGVFFAFSTFVMRALRKLPTHEGVAAMQSINVVVLNPVFLGTFVGTAGVGVASAVTAIVRWDMPGSPWLLAGGMLYVIGTFGVTMFGNVPMNNALASLAPASPEAADYWSKYLVGWTRWNHVRTIAAAGGMVAFAMALRIA
jgi:uncharacterized membrane protein